MAHVAEDEEILRELDRAPLLPPAAQEIAFELVKKAGLNDPEACEMLDDYASGRLVRSRLTATALAICEKRSDFGLSQYERSKNSLLACLILWDQPLDGYFAEYIYAWAADLGIDSMTVSGAFRARMS